MKFDPQKHHRRSIRLQGYDYSTPGGYFVTIVAQGRACLFGKIVGGEVVLNDAGKMILVAWLAIPTRFPSVELGTFVIMPNHFHGILLFHDGPVGATLVFAPDPDANPGLGSKNPGPGSHPGAAIK